MADIKFAEFSPPYTIPDSRQLKPGVRPHSYGVKNVGRNEKQQ